MGTSEVISSKEEKYKKMKLKDSGDKLKKFGKGKFHLKICCISDTHENHDKLKIPDTIDMLIYAGDFINWKTSKERSVKSFLDWFKKVNAKYKILVCGNHELYFKSLKKSKLDELIEDLKKDNILFLDNNFGNFSDLNLNIYGFPQTLKRNLFYLADAFEVKEAKMNEICNKNFDKKIDILVTHCPPYKILDKTYKNKYIGSLTILEDLILRVKPKIHIFGHITMNQVMRFIGLMEKKFYLLMLQKLMI
jgi:Icc-related predicted phosphoesterase